MNAPVQPYPERPVVRLPLTAGQHILHLILTVLTFGLWAPVWIWRGMSGNKAWADQQPGWQYGPYPYTGYAAWQYGPQRPGWQPPPPPEQS